jgi:hypothetical protein
MISEKSFLCFGPVVIGLVTYGTPNSPALFYNFRAWSIYYYDVGERFVEKSSSDIDSYHNTCPGAIQNG